MTTASTKTALITGANRGLGLGYVRRYLQQGWSVIATARTPGHATELNQLADAHPDRLTILPLDVSDENSAEELRQHFEAGELRLDLLINNAGLSDEVAFGGWTAKHFDVHYSTNVVGPALLTQAMAPLLNPDSKVINISSGLGSIELNIAPEGALDAYAMSKTALNMLTRRLAERLKSHGIIVVAINPGWVKTEMGGPDAPQEVEDTVERIAGTIDRLGLQQSGRFLSADGDDIPW